jgi:hypothetical protein
LPDLSHLLQTSVVDHLLNHMHGKSGYPEPEGFLVMMYARMVDKSLAEWSDMQDALSDFMQGGTPISRRFFAAQGMAEDLVIAMDRAMRFATALAQTAAASGLPRDLPSQADAERVRDFRNRIAHGDEDLLSGKGGKGIATATPELTIHGIGLYGISLTFAELATWITKLYDFARVLIAHRAV